MNRFLFLCLLLLLNVNLALAQRQTLFVAPKDTDSQIDTDLENHYVALNKSVTGRNQLFVFFPGTGAVPFNYLQIANLAADMGYHAVGLNYPNPMTVSTLCALATDLDCYGNVRREIIDGTDRTPLVNISRANSIENRLIKLLVYLHDRFPTEGWGRYLEGGNQIRWETVVVGGHSQGGGHAAVIGRYQSVVRVVMLASLDYNNRAMQPATWVARPETTPNATPPERFYAFSHTRDELASFTTMSTAIWPALGLLTFGPIINVDNTPPPYNNSHVLTSNLDSPTGNYHGSVAGDARLVLLPDGTPVYRPVWEYLLRAPLAAATVSAASYQPAVAPDAIVAGFGTNLAASTQASNTLPLPTTLAGTTIRVRDRLGMERVAPLFFVSPTQVNYLIPTGTATGAAFATIVRSDGTSSLSPLAITAVAPGMFTVDASGRGLAAATVLRVNANGQQTYESVVRFDAAQNKYVAVPIDLGPATDRVFLLLFGTGWRYRSNLSAVTLRIGGQSVEVPYAGAQGSLAGLDQINALLPRSLAGRGEVNIELSVDSRAANVTTINVK
jgi:uncharacterized protein (TIGR03437 family)